MSSGLVVFSRDRRVREDLFRSGVSENKTGFRLEPMSGLLWDPARSLFGSALALGQAVHAGGHAMILQSAAPATWETCSTL